MTNEELIKLRTLMTLVYELKNRQLEIKNDLIVAEDELKMYLEKLVLHNEASR